MNGCDDYRAGIQLYLDNELSSEDREEFRVHLKECEVCRTELEAEEELSSLLHRIRPSRSAPDILRQRVMQASVEPAFSSHSYAIARLGNGFSKILARPFQSPGRRPFNWAGFVAATILVIVGLLVLRGSLLQSRVNSYIKTAIEAHRATLNGGLPLEVQSESPGAVTRWFAGNVPFDFRLPSPPEESRNAQIYQLAGGRLVNYKGGSAALVAYQMQRQRISLLVASTKSAVAAGGKGVPSAGIVFHYTSKQTSMSLPGAITGLRRRSKRMTRPFQRFDNDQCMKNIDLYDQVPPPSCNTSGPSEAAICLGEASEIAKVVSRSRVEISGTACVDLRLMATFEKRVSR